MRTPLKKRVALAALLVSSMAVLSLAAEESSAQGNKYGQFAPPDAYVDGSELAYYGSENQWSRRQFSKEKADTAYKRRGQRQLLAILDGKPQEAVEWAGERLTADPDDLESKFNQVVGYCQLGELEQAFAIMQETVQAGLPIERFLAGPRRLLQPLTELPEFQDFALSRTSGLIHGPMLGCVTDHSARVWVRTLEEANVVVQVFACDQSGQATNQIVCSASAAGSAEKDYTATIELTGLEAETQYVYDVLIDNCSVLQGERPCLKTFPSTGEPGRLKLAFGGGAGYFPKHEHMWNTIAEHQPDALFLLGDNVYIDLAEKPRGLHRYTYYRRQSRPEFRRLVASTPVYAIWDDHDCGIDDVWMGPYLDRPDWKPAMLTVFEENWVNPAYGNDQAPGCWFEASLAGIDFFFLDTRYYRTNPFGERPTMLGPVQKEWLLARLKESQAPLKVIVSSVPFAPGSKPGSRDTWDGFPEERAEIFGWIQSHQIEGVIILSADRHRSEAWKIEQPDAYPLYDLMSSKLTNFHTHECIPGTLFCYNGSCSFGLLTIDTKVPDPTATYEVVNLEGETIETPHHQP